MADANFNIKLGLDATELVTISDQVGKRLEQLKAKLAALPEGSKDFVKIQREFNKINKEYEKGILNAQKFAAGQERIAKTTPSLKPLADGAKQARTAVTSLALVAQDLPFGFIGIQNNLPGVIQGFGNLKTELKGTIPALKALGQSLLGPAGAFLAFSAVTSAITFAVQEYGSLGNAINALLGKQSDLSNRIKITSDSLADYNKELRTNADIQGAAFASQAGNIQRVEALSKIVQDLSKSEQQRGNALKELQKIDKDYFGNISLAAKDVDKLRKATDLYTDALIRQATIKAFEDEITAIQKQIVQQETLRKGLKEQLEVAKQQEKQNKLVREQAAKLGGQVSGIVDPTIAANKALNEQAAIIEDLYKAREIFNEGLKDTINLQSQAFKPEFVAPTKSDLEKFRGITFQQDIDSSLARTTTDPLKLLNTVLANIRLNAINAEIAIKRLLNAQQQRRKEGDKELREGFTKIPGKAPQIIPGSVALENIQNLKKIQEAFKNTAIILNNTFFQPLSNAFEEFFRTGKFSIKAFGDAILSAIQSLVSKIIATGIISLIAGLAFPGVGGAGVAAQGFGRFGTAIRGVLGIGATAAPSLGGIQGGQLGFGGSVSLTLRGSDLVGALNRTNTTISRVG